MKHDIIIKGLKKIVQDKVVQADESDQIQEVPFESAPEKESAPEQVSLPDIEMPIIMEDVNAPIEEINIEDSEEPLPEIEISEKAVQFLNELEIPLEGANLRRIGNYDVLVVSQGLSLNRVQMRNLLNSGIVALANDADTGGLALIYPTGSKF